MTSACLPVCLSACLPVCLSACVCLCLLCLPVSACVCLCLSACLRCLSTQYPQCDCLFMSVSLSDSHLSARQVPPPSHRSAPCLSTSGAAIMTFSPASIRSQTSHDDSARRSGRRRAGRAARPHPRASPPLQRRHGALGRRRTRPFLHLLPRPRPARLRHRLVRLAARPR